MTFEKLDQYGPTILAFSLFAISGWSMGLPGVGIGFVALITVLAMPSGKTVYYFRDIAWPFTITLVWQFVHLYEKWVTGFAEVFPRSLGYEPSSLPNYMVLTLANLIVVSSGLYFLRKGTRIGTYAAWFLAMIGFVNGIAHPLLAIIFADDGWYYPGLYTAIVHLFLGTWLWISFPADGTSTRR
ncbi:MAG: hypothetical protein ABF335_00335 [Alphaproteobacteria bacterium]